MSKEATEEMVTVIEPFGDHRRGDRIPASEAVGHEANVNKTKED